jgi:FtsZ-binding cell division protein ZapB
LQHNDVTIIRKIDHLTAITKSKSGQAPPSRLFLLFASFRYYCDDKILLFSVEETPSVYDPRTKEDLLREMLKRLFKVNSERKSVMFHCLREFTVLDSTRIYEELARDPQPESDNISFLLRLLSIDKAVLETKRCPAITGTLENLFVTKDAAGSEKPDTGEGPVQKQLTKDWVLSNRYPQCFAIDTHLTSQNVPVFKLPHTDASPGSPASAKTDFLSTKAPLFLELKSGYGIHSGVLYAEDCDVLTQAIERVYMAGKVNEELKTVISFASTGRKNWIFILTRTYPSLLKYNEQKIEERYYLLPIAPKDVFPLWHILNEKPSNFFISESCVVLSEVLSSLGYHLGYCQLRLLHKCVLGKDEAGNANHTMVYEVTPGYVQRAEQYVTIPPHSETNSITVKLSVDSARGVNEYQIIQKLCLKESIAVDYVVMGLRSEANNGTLSKFEGDTQFLKRRHTKTNDVEVRKSHLGLTRFHSVPYYHVPLDPSHCSANCTSNLCWWNYARPEREQIPNFTAIVMHPGQRVRKLYPDETLSLRLLLEDHIHKHDVLHCDPRRQNILRFKSWVEEEKVDITTKLPTKVKQSVERVRLIDFDLSILKEDEGKEQSFSGDRKQLLETLIKQNQFTKHYAKGGKLFTQMTTALDSVMLENVILGFPTYPEQEPLPTNLFSAEFDEKLEQDHPLKTAQATEAQPAPVPENPT